jgi:hypothetical protein
MASGDSRMEIGNTPGEGNLPAEPPVMTPDPDRGRPSKPRATTKSAKRKGRPPKTKVEQPEAPKEELGAGHVEAQNGQAPEVALSGGTPMFLPAAIVQSD